MCQTAHDNTRKLGIKSRQDVLVVITYSPRLILERKTQFFSERLVAKSSLSIEACSLK